MSLLELQNDFIIAENSFWISGSNKVFQIMMVTIKIFVDEVLYRKELTQLNNLYMIYRSNFFMSA